MINSQFTIAILENLNLESNINVVKLYTQVVESIHSVMTENDGYVYFELSEVINDYVKAGFSKIALELLYDNLVEHASDY